MQKISKTIPPKPVKIPMPELPRKMDIKPEMNTDFEENSPFEEGVISETYRRWWCSG